MTKLEERYCSNRGCFKDCPYIPRNLEHKCNDLSLYTDGYFDAVDAIKKKIASRCDELWGKIPNSSDVLEGKITIEQARDLGRFTALESLESFVDALME